MYTNPLHKQKVIDILKSLGSDKLSEILYNIPNNELLSEIINEIGNETKQIDTELIVNGIDGRKVALLFKTMPIQQILDILNNTKLEDSYLVYKVLRWLENEKIAEILDSIHDLKMFNKIASLIYNYARVPQIKEKMKNETNKNSSELNFEETHTEKEDNQFEVGGNSKTKRSLSKNKRKTKRKVRSKKTKNQ